MAYGDWMIHNNFAKSIYLVLMAQCQAFTSLEETSTSKADGTVTNEVLTGHQFGLKTPLKPTGFDDKNGLTAVISYKALLRHFLVL